MKPIQGGTYTVPGSSLYVYVRKVRHVSSQGYTKAIVEFVKKDKWVVFQTIKSAKLYHDKVSHWQKVVRV